MSSRLRHVTTLIFTLILAAAGGVGFAAQAPVERLVRPGAPVVLSIARCIRIVTQDPALVVASEGDTKFAIYRTPADLAAAVQINLKIGESGPDPAGECPDGRPQTFSVTPVQDFSPSPEVVSKAGQILFFAFIAAILLENAFALVFNWRLFLEFMSGRAWKTPLMFVGSLIVVKLYQPADIFRSLLTLYSPGPEGAGVPSTGFTQTVSAMILGGGSAGVNRLMIALGFRSPFKPQELVPSLSEDEAWVSIRVQGKVDERTCEVCLTEIAATEPRATPATLAVLRNRKVSERLLELFFTNPLRTPPTGGRRVSTRCDYAITVAVPNEGGSGWNFFDADGQELESPDIAAGSVAPPAGSPTAPVDPPAPGTRRPRAKAYRFASRAIVDIVIRIP